MTTPYDLIVIGGGSAGLTAAGAAAVLGLRVALIEKARLGGDCTWTGCVPSKTLLAAAKAAHTARESAFMGVHADGVRVDFPALMDHVRRTRQQIYEDESPEVMRREGIDVYETGARFHDAHTVELADGGRLRGKRFLIAAGAHPRVPAGFEDAPYLTSHTLFDLTEQPGHLIIVGGGPVGTEMAQAFQRLGTPVTLITEGERLLPRDDPEASAFIMDTLRAEGVTLRTGTTAAGAEGTTGDVRVRLADGETVTGTHLLLATGKQVDVSDMNPQAAGIATEGGRLLVDRRLRTSQPHIFAAGDVSGGPQFTHIAAAQAASALTNMVLPVALPAVRATVPWTTFTDPEAAHAGLTEAQARQKQRDVHVTRLPMHRADRAMTEGQPGGFMKLVHTQGGKLLGATIVGVNAGEMMNEWAGIIQRGGKVRDIVATTHIYPTMGSTSEILATEQLRHQMESGHWLGRVVRAAAKLRFRLMRL